MKLLACEVILASGVWLGQVAANTVPPEPALWERRPVPAGEITIVASFSPGVSGPEFRVSFTNTSDEATDALNVFLQESIRLDGEVYPRLLVQWVGGIPPIPSKGRWSHTLAVSDFLPGERGEDGRLPLGSGLHTIRALVGPAASEELTFAWNPRE